MINLFDLFLCIVVVTAGFCSMSLALLGLVLIIDRIIREKKERKNE